MSPEFDYQWSKIPSPAIELNSDRINEFLKFTNLPANYFKDKICLDAGCGSGRYTWVMQELGAKVISFDISPDAIEKCIEINPDAYVQDIYSLEPDPKYDFILCWGVLHHLPDPEKGFKMIVSQLKQKGILHIMVYHKSTQKIYEQVRSIWKGLTNEEKIIMCKFMINKHGGNLHGWYDAFNPKYNWSYKPKDIRKWFKRNGFKNIVLTQKKNINMRGQLK